MSRASAYIVYRRVPQLRLIFAPVSLRIAVARSRVRACVFARASPLFLMIDAAWLVHRNDGTALSSGWIMSRYDWLHYWQSYGISDLRDAEKVGLMVLFPTRTAGIESKEKTLLISLDGAVTLACILLCELRDEIFDWFMFYLWFKWFNFCIYVLFVIRVIQFLYLCNLRFW